MAVKQDSVISELKLRIRLLEKQNEQQAGRMEEKLLMWLVSDTIKEANGTNDLLNNVLDRISVILDIPYSCCYQIHNNQFEILKEYSASTAIPKDFFKIQLPHSLLNSLSENPVYLTLTDLKNSNFSLHEGLLTEVKNVALFPFQSIYFPFGVFVFFETQKSDAKVKSLGLVIRHLIQLAVEKLENLNLQQELKDLNVSFKERVKKRAEKLISEQQKLQQETKAVQKDDTITASVISSAPPDKFDTLFMRNVGVEVRTPVNGILGFAELLRETQLSEKEQNDYINIVKSCGKSMLQVIDDAVDYAYLKSGQVKLIPVEFAITPFLTELYDLYKRDELFRQRENLELKLNVNVNGNAKIRTDRDRLKQIISSLLWNAIKFTKSGSIELGCFVDAKNEKDANQPNLIFFVKDTGVGIPDEVGKLVFEPFYKIEHEISSLYGGMGLGLTIVKELTELMGGKVWFESEEGVGSQFYLSLLAERLLSNESEKRPEKSKSYNWSNKKFLVVEDDEMSYIYLREVLKSTNAETILAKDGNEAVEIVKNNNDLDLILMDIKLPGMSGLEATGIIKRIKDIPVIVQTAYAMADDHRRILETGCDDYVTKPINRKRLLKSIAKVLKESDS